jgi:hypothetical protein
MWPRSRRASRIPSARTDSLAASTVARYPIRGTFFGCCARAENGRAKSIEQKTRRVILLRMEFCPRLSLLSLHFFDVTQDMHCARYLEPDRRAKRTLRKLPIDMNPFLDPLRSLRLTLRIRIFYSVISVRSVVNFPRSFTYSPRRRAV